MIAIAVAGFFFGRHTVKGQITSQLEQVVGPEAAEAVETMLANADKLGSKSLPAILGVVMLFIGAMGLFSELRSAMNTVWKVQPTGSSGILAFLRGYLISFIMVLVIAALLFLMVVANALLSAVRALSAIEIVAGQSGGELGHLVVDHHAPFRHDLSVAARQACGLRDVWLGAAITSILFSVGSWLIGFYLVHAGIGSVYGAAGSLAVLLTWLYYSAQVFLFGAELTVAFARQFGR